MPTPKISPTSTLQGSGSACPYAASHERAYPARTDPETSRSRSVLTNTRAPQGLTPLGQTPTPDGLAVGGRDGRYRRSVLDAADRPDERRERQTRRFRITPPLSAEEKWGYLVWGPIVLVIAVSEILAAVSKHLK